MAQNEGNSVAIVALIVVALLVAGAAFLYFQNDTAPPAPVERRTIIELPPPEAPAEPEQKENKQEDEDPGFSFEHEDEEGRTKIETP